MDEALLKEINQLVVDAGHTLVKKKEAEAFKLKTNSYVPETNVHFPTDLNLLGDSLRKCLDTIKDLQKITFLKGWRKIKNIRKMLKSLFRGTSHKVFRGKNEHQKKQYVKQYLYRRAMQQCSFRGSDARTKKDKKAYTLNCERQGVLKFYLQV